MQGKVKFVDRSNSDFFKVLRKRINEHFETNHIKKTGDYRMVLKSIAMLGIYLLPFILILTSLLPVWATYICWVIMGLGLAGSGMSVMHDAVHGVYSENKTVNTWMGHSMYLFGANTFNWKIQHNILHHTYTNVYGMDEDIHDKPMLRLSPYGKLGFVHKYQHIYGFVLYGLATLSWTLNKDFKQIMKYHKNNMIEGNGSKLGRELTDMIIGKLLYYAVFVVLPILITPYSALIIISGFLLMHFVAGVVLSTIFQLAHVVESTEHHHEDGTGEIENSWAIHQLHTTANFAKKNRILSWYVGGLNYQIEHHLFHNICHVHYKDIAPIVKSTAQEYGIPYNEYRTFWQALGSHIKMLKQIGRNSLAA
ncbi:MAG: acyl-CoA desaturase [Bacteroidetes bacterium]|nr:acyl-CoA desaturase [Bacteroidota bacterium]MBP7400399.1 acyl-CoA desaturase [Chitinophagales bacterium]MBK8487975.1 acyl-CoA desaturase [Bacteroidota bacterium]MBK8682267.1 acyl-CoA desaturase [Bacteroidota bacterium]MBP8753767.1 acyl-CoA desaturase [Chitinophagales bacterium]